VIDRAKRKQKIWRLTLASLVLILGAFLYFKNRRCITSFRRFAYHGPRYDTPIAVDILPLPPWQLEAELPSGYQRHDIQAKTARSGDGYQEIWLGDWLPYDPAMIVYHTELGRWEEISPYVGDTRLFVLDLFLTTNGSLWGSVKWETSYPPLIRSTPVLARFNDDTRAFEFEQNVLEVPVSTGPQILRFPKILLDEQDVFWIFVDGDGIYTYDPALQRTERKTDFPDNFVVDTAALAPDGTIYIEHNQGWPNNRLTEDAIFQFFPETGELVSLDAPDEKWPNFDGMVVDHMGRLWLGSIGYREPSGDWHLMINNLREYLRHVDSGNYRYWVAPYVMLESSTGILWYQKYFDTGPGATGTAWYDPDTGRGCLFTNQPAFVIEDAVQRLWLAAGGNLYSYSLVSSEWSD
jgi:hypothetical protein